MSDEEDQYDASFARSREDRGEPDLQGGSFHDTGRKQHREHRMEEEEEEEEEEDDDDDDDEGDDDEGAHRDSKRQKVSSCPARVLQH
jgi:hypothetical protein